MRVGLEAKVVSPRAGGIGRYAASLMRSMFRVENPGPDRIDYVLFTGPQTDRAMVDGLGGRCAERYSHVKSSLLRSLVSLPAGIARERLDVFHGFDHVGLPVVSGRCRCVVTIHDIIPLSHPQWFPRKHRFVVRTAIQRILRRAERVIVPTGAVRDDLLERGMFDAERIAVIPEGCDSRFSPDADGFRIEAVRRRYGLPSSYVLFVGTLEPRKNLSALIEAVRLLGREDVSLVLAGAPGWHSKDLVRAAAHPDVRDRVHFAGFVDDEDLPDLYRGARLFAFPSLAEGFGLPVLEAMGCGVPVLTSTHPAIAEVAGDAALTVDAGSVEAIGDAMRRLLDDDALRADLRARGIERASGFSWDTAAVRTLEQYRRAAA
jgi:glycosyltransferase involved in cell wall biosynthesis